MLLHKIRTHNLRYKNNTMCRLTKSYLRFLTNDFTGYNIPDIMCATCSSIYKIYEGVIGNPHPQWGQFLLQKERKNENELEVDSKHQPQFMRLRNFRMHKNIDSERKSELENYKFNSQTSTKMHHNLLHKVERYEKQGAQVNYSKEHGSKITTIQ